jgi:hypothetical protein
LKKDAFLESRRKIWQSYSLRKRSVSGHCFSDAAKGYHSEWLQPLGLAPHSQRLKPARTAALRGMPEGMP